MLDVFGDVNERGEGPAHHVVAADFDGDGDDEFLVALRGPMPLQGVFYYKAVDVRRGSGSRPGSRRPPPPESPLPTSTATAGSTSPQPVTTPPATSWRQPPELVFLNRYGAPTEAQPAIPSGPLGG